MSLPITPPSSGEGKIVLTVDDDADVNAICRGFLEKAGFSVLTATGSSEALKICKQHQRPINLLITDLVLPPPGFSLASSDNEFPHVHGHELAIRALRIHKDLRVVLMSGNVDTDLAGYGIRRAAIPFLVKPFDYETLMKIVNQTFQAPPPTPESLMKETTKGPRGADEWFD
jgi:DNA-binding NtrC family response regulator